MHHNKPLKGIVRATTLALIMTAYPSISSAVAPNEYQKDGWIQNGSDSAAWGGGADFTNSQILNGARLEIGVGCKGSGTFCANLDYDSQDWFFATAKDTIVAGKGDDGNAATLFIAGTSSGTIVKDGGQEYVAKGTYVASASTPEEQIPWVLYPATSTGTTVGDGGLQRVYGGGTAINTLVQSGGRQYVYRGGDGSKAADEAGKAIGSVVEAGGLQYVYLDGATAVDTQINGGKQYVYGNATAIGSIINSGGLQYVYKTASASGGYVEDTIINAGGQQQVLNGAFAKDTTVNGGMSVIDAGATHTGKLDVNSGIAHAVTSNDTVFNIENISLKGANSLLRIAENVNNAGTQSYLNVENLDNNGVVQFTTAKNNDATDISTFTPVIFNVGKLTGNKGVFSMHADIGAGTGDLLRINQLDAASKSKLFIANNGASNAQESDVLIVVETVSGGADSQFALSNKVEQGGYEFGLKQVGNNWVLCADASCARAGGNESGSNLSASSTYSANFLNISYLVNYVETQTLMQRMGDLRNTENPADIDVWVRAFTGKVDSFDGGKLSGFDIDYSGTQIGADKRFNLTGGKIYLGGMLGYTDASPNYSGKADSSKGTGSNKVNNYSLGIYGSYVNNQNFYVDGLIRYNDIKNDFKVADTANNMISGDAKTKGYGISLETGKRFYVYDLPKGFVYLEPQAQLSYAHQDSSSVKNSNGLKVNIESYKSTLGRLSAIVGYETQNTANPVNVYFKTGYVREFNGDNVGYYLNGSREEHSFRGNFWDNEIGISMRIQKQHTLHADIGYAAGDRFNKTQLNAGYRFEF